MVLVPCCPSKNCILLPGDYPQFGNRWVRFTESISSSGRDSSFTFEPKRSWIKVMYKQLYQVFSFKGLTVSGFVTDLKLNERCSHHLHCGWVMTSAAVQRVAGLSHALVLLVVLIVQKTLLMFSHKIVCWKFWNSHCCTFLITVEKQTRILVLGQVWPNFLTWGPNSQLPSHWRARHSAIYINLCKNTLLNGEALPKIVLLHR